MPYEVLFLDTPQTVQPSYRFSVGRLTIQGREVILEQESGPRLVVSSLQSVQWLHAGCHGWVLKVAYERGFLLLAVLWLRFLGVTIYHPWKMRALKRDLNGLTHQSGHSHPSRSASSPG